MREPGWRHRGAALLTHPRFLLIYSAVVTVAFVIALFGGLSLRTAAHLRIDELDVQRINVREPDGTLRLVIADNARFPGATMFGQEYPHDDRKADRTAGLIFLDGEGSESGGLIFGGQKGADGAVHRFGHLSFDRYDQDQVMALEGGEADGKHSSTIAFNDQPAWALSDLLAASRAWQHLPDSDRKAAEAAYLQQHGGAHRRALLGRQDDASSALDLRDAAGRTRLIARVTADGTATLQALDANGHVTRQWPEPNAPRSADDAAQSASAPGGHRPGQPQEQR